MGSMNQLHTLFLQAMMSRAIVSKQAAFAIVKHCAELLGYSYVISAADLATLLDEVNEKIGKIGMELKEIRAEHNMEPFVVLVNSFDHSNSIDKLKHIYNVKERELFRRILEMIVTNADSYGTVNTMDCINIPGSGMSRVQIEESLTKFSSDYWFLNTAEGSLCPGPRCIAEFEMYFKTNYSEHIATCPLCTNIVFFGGLCDTCEAICHKMCIIKFNKGRENPKCSCGVEFPNNTITEDDLNRADPPQPSKRSRVQNGHSQQQNGHADTAGPSRRASKRHRE